MATIAAIFDRFVVTRGVDRAASQYPGGEDVRNVIRPFASEDIFFFTKPIDNSRLVRQIDPSVGRSQNWMIGGSLAGTMALIAILLPALYSAFAGYKIEALRQEKNRLLSERTSLELAEAKSASPRRMEEMATKQHLVDPEPQSIVFLEGRQENTVAKQMGSAAKALAQ